ncbi:tyrosine-type recombinase/integrase [Oceanicella actignis]|uniref:Integrase n=1 Tax=Oceanicella actignis TaxID=1189325 RepID=A0A1M7SNA0_9RHOB|nr:integrase arm-type DNA-binding domain-containing protein [Oceanicella actignis]SES64451.1 Integrase [Oceanicella actignis]SHN59982.1 Integrase [Oceanicella actignis]
MSRRGKRLTTRFCSTAGPGRYHDGGGDGLCLLVKPSGSRFWIQRVTIDGKRRDIGLGPFPAASLTEARARAAANKALVREGKGAELLHRTDKSCITFDEAAERYLSKRIEGLSNEKHRAQWRSTLATYAFPALGHMPVDRIGLRDVLRALEPIWEAKPETAARLRGRIEAVLSWATVAGYREGDNPARWKGNLAEVLPAPSALKRRKGADHHPAVALVDLPRWWARLGEVGGMGAAALRFAALTAARSGEVRGATWGEIEGLHVGRQNRQNRQNSIRPGELAIWRIPAARMKMKRDHVAPLSRAALEVLEAVTRIEGEALIFPGARAGRPMSDMTLAKAMKAAHARDLAAGGPGFCDPRSGRPAVPHGLRSSFRDWAAERGYERDLAELALAHDVGSAVERAYRRSDMVERRRAMMDAWADFLEGRETSGNVLDLRPSASRSAW